MNIPKADFAIIGGSGTLSSNFPLGAKCDDVNIIKDNMVFDTPYGKKPKIAFQLFIYDKLLRANGLDKGCRIIDSVYSTAKLFSGPPQSEYMGEEFYGLMDEGLGKVLEEMSDLSVPFRRTEDEEVCAYCDFRTICGR